LDSDVFHAPPEASYASRFKHFAACHAGLAMSNGEAVHRGGGLKRRRIPGVDLAASVIGLGGANFTTYDQAAALCDAYFAAGGNVLDSAWIYGQGTCDRLFGAWIEARGVRGEIIVIGKGAHTPHCRPEAIAPQLSESLERLRTETIDVYFMHRDDPDIPVGEFVDAVDAEIRAGRIRTYGGSNWSRERLDAASDYAANHGRVPPTALSNNFSLAEMVEPVWPGTVASSDEAWKSWLRARQLALFAWSSQARGFFTDRAGPDRRDDPEFVRAWYSDRNFARRDRAIEMGRRLGRSALQVALAYCLHQDFPVLPLIGPLALDELRESLDAADLELAADDVRWLEAG